MGKILEVITNIWGVPELRRKIVVTLGLLAVFRVLANIPLPGVDPNSLKNLLETNALFGLFNLFSGSSLQNFSIASLGLGPYISASVIFQLLAMAIPKIEEMRKEASGNEKINQWTRMLTVPLAAVQGIGFYFILSKQLGILSSLSPWEVAIIIVTLTAGTIILMWLGELITEHGLGNGISIIIAAGIVSRVPQVLGQAQATITADNFMTYLSFAVAAILIIMAIVGVNEGERRIPIHYARRVQSGGKLSEAQSHLPLKVNQAGVMPIIFALSLVMIPGAIGQYLSRINLLPVKEVALWLVSSFTPQHLIYNGFYFLLVVGFTYFYTAVTFNPEKIAEDLKKYGGFIPGIRPGRPTQDFLNWVLTRITLSGAVFLATIAVLPSLMQSAFSDGAMLAVGGTSVLIVVSVVLETLKQVESLMVMRDYDSFLK